MDSSREEGQDGDVPASSSSAERNEGDSVVAQLLEIAQNLDSRENITRDKTVSAESGHETRTDDDKGKDADGESKEDDDEDKDPYEKSGKEGNFKCHCKYFKGNPCYTRYKKDELLAYRSQFKALNKQQLDIAILCKIQTGMHLSPMTCQKKRAHTERKMVRSDHYFHGDKICRETFCFIHRISHNKLSVLMTHYRGSGITVRVMKRDIDTAERQKQREINKAKTEKQKSPGKGKKPRTQKPRKRKQKNDGKEDKSKKQREEDVSNNVTDAGEVAARDMEDMHQFVDIPLSAPAPVSTPAPLSTPAPRAAENKQFVGDTRLPETSQQNHPQQQVPHGVDSDRPGHSGSEQSDASIASHMIPPNHHGVWHLPRRPDMQYHGSDSHYMLPQ